MQYRVEKRNLQVDRTVDFRYKNALFDQNFSFAWSTKPFNINSKQKISIMFIAMSESAKRLERSKYPYAHLKEKSGGYT